MKLIRVRCKDAVDPELLGMIDKLVSLEEKWKKGAIRICPAAKAEIEKYSNFYISKFKQAKTKNTEREIKQLLESLFDAPEGGGINFDKVIEKYDKNGKLEDYFYVGKESKDIVEQWDNIIEACEDDK